MSFLSPLWPDDPLVVATTVALTITILACLRQYLYPRHPRIIPSPLKTVIPHLSDDEIARLDYRPDEFPGARDIETPYGSTRVYEFGPTTGRKILLVHGISTSCITLGRLAHGLAARGNRVMLFDLVGRGFSDGVGDLPHDARLYVAQAMCVLAAASPTTTTAAWLAGFDLVGYSLGGGIAVHLAAAVPGAVRSLTLLAPAGMIRPESFGAATRFVFTAGLVPERVLAALTRWKLQKPIASSAARRGSRVLLTKAPPPPPPPVDTKEHHHHHHKTSPVSLATSEVQHTNPAASTAREEEHADALERRVMRYVRWMLSNHDGFVPAFMSTIREAPLMGQHAAYARLGAIRRPGTTCVILGDRDEIIDAEAYGEDALPLLGGEERVRWRVLAGASHDFPMTHAEETLVEMDRFWAAFPAAEESIA